MSKGITALDLSDEDMIRLFREMLGHLSTEEVAQAIMSEYDGDQTDELIEKLND